MNIYMLGNIICIISTFSFHWASVSNATFQIHEKWNIVNGIDHGNMVDDFVRDCDVLPRLMSGRVDEAWSKVLDFYIALGNTEMDSANAPFKGLGIEGFKVIMRQNGEAKGKVIRNKYTPFRAPMNGLPQKIRYARFMEDPAAEKPLQSIMIQVKAEVPDISEDNITLEGLSHQAVFRLHLAKGRSNSNDPKKWEMKFHEVKIFHGLLQSECQRRDFFQDLNSSNYDE